MVVSGSIDRTCRLWDVSSGQCVHVRQGHSDEVLDVCFDATGKQMASASADATARVYNTATGACTHVLEGHGGEISKVSFNPQGTKLITASSDKTCKLWDVSTGSCAQTLEGHTDEIFSARSTTRVTTSSRGARTTRAGSGRRDEAERRARAIRCIPLMRSRVIPMNRGRLPVPARRLLLRRRRRALPQEPRPVRGRRIMCDPCGGGGG